MSSEPPAGGVVHDAMLRALRLPTDPPGVPVEELYVSLWLTVVAQAGQRAIALRPDLAQAHLSLGGLYRELGYLDLAERHLRTYLSLARKFGLRYVHLPVGYNGIDNRQDHRHVRRSFAELLVAR